MSKPICQSFYAHRYNWAMVGASEHITIRRMGRRKVTLPSNTFTYLTSRPATSWPNHPLLVPAKCRFTRSTYLRGGTLPSHPSFSQVNTNALCTLCKVCGRRKYTKWPEFCKSVHVPPWTLNFKEKTEEKGRTCLNVHTIAMQNHVLPWFCVLIIRIFTDVLHLSEGTFSTESRPYTILTRLEPRGLYLFNQHKKGGGLIRGGIRKGALFFLLPKNVISQKLGIAVHTHANTKETGKI